MTKMGSLNAIPLTVTVLARGGESLAVYRVGGVVYKFLNDKVSADEARLRCELSWEMEGVNPLLYVAETHCLTSIWIDGSMPSPVDAQQSGLQFQLVSGHKIRDARRGNMVQTERGIVLVDFQLSRR